jgi:hypothetical protein
MEVVDHAGLAPETLRELSRQIGSLGLLQDVLRWGFSQSPPCELAEVVVQDEFTHDVVMEWIGGRYLVFDTT